MKKVKKFAEITSKAGRRAARDGDRGCPYPPDSQAFADWWIGYEDEIKQMKKRKEYAKKKK